VSQPNLIGQEAHCVKCSVEINIRYTVRLRISFICFHLFSISVLTCIFMDTWMLHLYKCNVIISKYVCCTVKSFSFIQVQMLYTFEMGCPSNIKTSTLKPLHFQSVLIYTHTLINVICFDCISPVITYYND